MSVLNPPVKHSASRAPYARPRPSAQHSTMVEQKAAVAMMEIEQSELDRVSEAFGYNLISTSRRALGSTTHSPPSACSAQTPSLHTDAHCFVHSTC